MTTALFLLRCTEIGIAIADLDLLTIGLVMDMWTEKGNDGATYDKVALVSSRRKLSSCTIANTPRLNLFVRMQ